VALAAFADFFGSGGRRISTVTFCSCAGVRRWSVSAEMFVKASANTSACNASEMDMPTTGRTPT
jgi:hypothetical protein